MPTIDDLILSTEVELEQAMKERERQVVTLRNILAKVNADGRANLSEDEERDVATAERRRDKATGDIKGIRQRLSNAHDAKVSEEQIAAELVETRADPHTTVGAKPAYDRVARVTREERTYHQGNCRTGKEFLEDVAAQFLMGDLEAQARLSRHQNEERIERGQYMQRAVGSSAFTGLVVPQYLTEMYAPAVAARRPFADVCTHHDLPQTGNQVNISRITTASSVALQASENTAVSETNMDDTLLTINVQTAGGQQTVSRQALERGIGIEDVTMGDLQRRYSTNLDSTLINQASTGLAAVAIGTAGAYADASPTPAEMWPKILAAMSASETALLGEANPDIAVMHPRRWYWMQSQVGTSWPFVGQPGLPPQNGALNFATTYGTGARGVLPNGTVVITDANVPTTVGAGTEDEIYIVPSDECHLWEDPNAPQFIRAEQVAAASLGVLLVLYGYFAYTYQRYANSHQKVAGTGLIAPVF